MSYEAIGKYNFETGVYRPPSEGGSDSLLIRVTRNCPWNKCEFCGMYKEEKFSIRSVDEIKRDIDSIADIRNDLLEISRGLGRGGEIDRDVIIALIEKEPELNSSQGFIMVLNWLQSGGKTAFLQDANSLIMKTPALVSVLKHLRETFLTLNRVTSYARSKTIARKTGDELKAIREAGLDRLHVGLESGDDEVLKKVKKGSSSEEHILGGKKAMAAGFQLSEYWMPGLGGERLWENHAKNTARVLNEINPHYIRSRPFRPWPGTPMHAENMRGELHPLGPRGQLNEIRLMVESLDVDSRVCFDHAGNHWRNPRGGLLFSQSYEGYKFPGEKQMLLDLIEEGLSFEKTSIYR